MSKLQIRGGRNCLIISTLALLSTIFTASCEDYQPVARKRVARDSTGQITLLVDTAWLGETQYFF